MCKYVGLLEISGVLRTCLIAFEGKSKTTCPLAILTILPLGSTNSWTNFINSGVGWHCWTTNQYSILFLGLFRITQAFSSKHRVWAIPLRFRRTPVIWVSRKPSSLLLHLLGLFYLAYLDVTIGTSTSSSRTCSTPLPLSCSEVIFLLLVCINTNISSFMCSTFCCSSLLWILMNNSARLSAT